MVTERKAFVTLSTFKELQPAIILTRFVGMCPISFRRYGTGYVVKWSLKSGVYSYIFLMILGSASLLGFIDDLRVEPQFSVKLKSDVDKFINCSDFALTLFMVIFGVVLAPFKVNDLLRALDRIYKIDQLMPPKDKKGRCVLVLFATFSLLILVSVFDMLMRIKANHRLENTTLVVFGRCYCYYLTYGCVVIQEIYYWHMVNLTKGRLESLRGLLKSKCRNMKRANTIPEFTLVKTNKLPIPLVSLEDALKLTKIHKLICETIEALDNLLGFHILWIILNCSFHLVVNPYFLLLETIKQGSSVFMALQIIWILIHFTRLFFVVNPPHLTSAENQKNLSLVFKLLTLGLDEDVKRQLITLSHQMAYGTGGFSSCGLFKIDRSILACVAGSSTTFLVILFQFAGNNNTFEAE